MKSLIALSLTLLFAGISQAQLKTSVICENISVDILDGKVNGLRPDFIPAQIKKKLPCFTSEEPEDASSKCGGGVFYKDKDLSFYTGRDYVEIGPNFKGKLSVPLMGASRTGMFKWLGNPRIKDVNWDAYEMAYGIMILYFSKAGKVVKIIFSNKGADTIQLCQ